MFKNIDYIKYGKISILVIDGKYVLKINRYKNFNCQLISVNFKLDLLSLLKKIIKEI